MDGHRIRVRGVPAARHRGGLPPEEIAASAYRLPKQLRDGDPPAG